MPIWRVFQKPDGGMVVMIPNPKSRKEGETDAQLCERVCSQDAARDKNLAGLPFIDVDRDSLPPRNRTTDKGEMERLRHAWTVQDGRVVIDEGKVKEKQ